jgi:FkbM family methyltransferase
MNISKISYKSRIGKIIRIPLKLIPPNMVLPIVQGPLKGKKWIKGSSINGCWLGSYEYDKQMLFKEYLKAGMVVYDIGANAGFYTLLSSILIGSKGKTYAFEPFPMNLKNINKHIKLNNIKNVEIIPMAVSAKIGKQFFKVGKNNSQGMLTKEGEIEVDTITLDAFVRNGAFPPDLVKMDIEGAEFDALTGAKEILVKFKPVIFLATHGKEIHSNCINLLKSFGYNILPLGAGMIETDEIIATF